MNCWYMIILPFEATLRKASLNVINTTIVFLNIQWMLQYIKTQ